MGFQTGAESTNLESNDETKRTAISTMHKRTLLSTDNDSQAKRTRQPTVERLLQQQPPAQAWNNDVKVRRAANRPNETALAAKRRPKKSGTVMTDDGRFGGA